MKKSSIIKVFKALFTKIVPIFWSFGKKYENDFLISGQSCK